jgi:hypothetical protein
MDVSPEIVMFIVSLVASFLVARRFGGKAGTDAAIKHEERKEERERIAALQALLNQVKLIRKIAESNTSQDDYVTHSTSFVELPTQAFETAFVSERPALSNQSELLGVVSDYLSKAYVVNSNIDFLARIEATPISEMSQVPQRVFRLVRDDCQALSVTLDRLEGFLEVEIGT